MGETKQAVVENFAIITGASQGLGKALAYECAGRKINMVLLALPNEGLADFATALQNQFGIQTLVYETDLSVEANCFLFFDWLRQQQLNIYILINNAGLGSMQSFGNMQPEFYQKQIHINITTPVLLTRLLLPLLQQQPQAYILNISSLANFFHIPGKEVYGASKAFLYSFSKSLRNALYNTRVSVSVICPGGINTNERVRAANKSLKGIAAKSICEPEEVAKMAIDGMLRKRPVIIPGHLNQLTLWINRILPANIKNSLIRRTAAHQSAVLNNKK